MRLTGRVTPTSTGVVHSRQPSAVSVHVRQPSSASVHVRQPSVGSVHVMQPSEPANHLRQPSTTSVHSRVESLYSEKTPQDAENELQQCINQLSEKTASVPPGILKKPKQRAPKPKPPVRTSSIEPKTTTSAQSKPQSRAPPSGRQQQRGQFESATTCIEAYATLPRKPGQRAGRQGEAPELSAEVYESYLQRQRAAASCMPGAQGTVAASGGSAVQRLSDRRMTGGEGSTHPGIMEQLVHEGLIPPHAKDSDQQGRLTPCGWSKQQEVCPATAVTGRRTPQPQGGQFAQPGGEVRRSHKKKHWAVTEALYSGRPTTCVTQQRPNTPTSSQQGSHSSQQGMYPTRTERMCMDVFSSQ